MVLLAGFQALLARYGGHDDVVVGSPVAGRTRRETEGLIGLFMNTLALRADLSGDPSFAALVGRVRETTLDALAHQDLPFETLVEELRPERSLSHSPLFQALFALQNTGESALRLGAVEAEPLSLDWGTSKNDLALYAVEEPAGVRCSLVYNPDLWDAATARRMLGHFAALLESAAARPSLPLSRLETMDAAERRLVVESWNDTARPWPAGACVHALIEAQARRTAGRPRAGPLGRALTYAELDARAGRLARRLARWAWGPRRRWPCACERSADVVAAMLAVLKAGGAYLPLDPAYPRRAAGVHAGGFGRAGAGHRSGALRGLLPAAGAGVVSTDDVWPAGTPPEAGSGAVQTGVAPGNAPT